MAASLTYRADSVDSLQGFSLPACFSPGLKKFRGLPQNLEIRLLMSETCGLLCVWIKSSTLKQTQIRGIDSFPVVASLTAECVLIKLGPCLGVVFIASHYSL